MPSWWHRCCCLNPLLINYCSHIDCIFRSFFFVVQLCSGMPSWWQRCCCLNPLLIHYCSHVDCVFRSESFAAHSACGRSPFTPLPLIEFAGGHFASCHLWP